MFHKFGDFNNNGIVRSASELGLNNNDFKDYHDVSSNKSSCSIVDDSTGTVRRIRKLILEECPQLGSAAGSSWFKRDSSNNNIIKVCTKKRMRNKRILFSIY